MEEPGLERAGVSQMAVEQGDERHGGFPALDHPVRVAVEVLDERRVEPLLAFQDRAEQPPRDVAQPAAPAGAEIDVPFRFFGEQAPGLSQRPDAAVVEAGGRRGDGGARGRGLGERGERGPGKAVWFPRGGGLARRAAVSFLHRRGIPRPMREGRLRAARPARGASPRIPPAGYAESSPSVGLLAAA